MREEGPSPDWEEGGSVTGAVKEVGVEVELLEELVLALPEKVAVDGS